MNTSVAARMVLRGGPISPFVRKVSICVLEKGLEGQVERVRAVTAIATPNVELQRFNPLSKIPTLTMADGSALFDSDVICEYLDTTHPPMTLYPASGPARWQALRWCALGTGMLDILVLWRTERNRPRPQQMQTILDAQADKINAALDLIEAELPEVQATPLAIGHIALGCALGYLDFRFADIDWRGSRPRARTWFAEFLRRPSVLRTMPYEKEPPAQSTPHFWESK
jgi:glutathione S-transferase